MGSDSVDRNMNYRPCNEDTYLTMTAPSQRPNLNSARLHVPMSQDPVYDECITENASHFVRGPMLPPQINQSRDMRKYSYPTAGILFNFFVII